MRRLTALIKKIIPFPPETQQQFFKIARVLDLAPGEWIPDDLPTGTTIFVEEGFLLLTRWQNKKWKCRNFYYEGTATVTYSDGAPEMKAGSYRVRAVETSRIYYLTSDDEEKVKTFFPGYVIAMSALKSRSFIKNKQRSELLEFSPPEKVVYLDKYFPTLYRAPLDALIEFLDIKGKTGKIVLEAFQKGRLSGKKQSPISKN